MLASQCLSLAGTVTTATITITNVPSAGNTLTIGANVRTWRASVTTPATEVLIGASIGASATNLYNQIAANQYVPPYALSFSSSNVVTLRSGVDIALAPVASGTWATIGTSTQASGGQTAVVVPMSALSNQARTNSASLVVQGLNSYSQTALSETATATSNLINKGQTQTATGAKTFLSITTSNLVNVGSAVSSTGSAASSEQFGTGALAVAPSALAVGRLAQAEGTNSAAIGYGAATAVAATSGLAVGNYSSVTAAQATAVGDQTLASGARSVALGEGASATANDGIAIGNGSTVSHTNSVAINGTSSAANQILLGGTGHNVSIPGTLTGTILSSTLTNTTSRGQVTATSDLSFTRANITSLANGNNAAVNFGAETVYAKIKIGPTGAFSLNGIAGGRNGRYLIVHNSTGQNMTISYDSGTDPTPANRIYTDTGADVVGVANSTAIFVYDSEDSRWWLVSHSP